MKIRLIESEQTKEKQIECYNEEKECWINYSNNLISYQKRENYGELKQAQNNIIEFLKIYPKYKEDIDEIISKGQKPKKIKAIKVLMPFKPKSLRDCSCKKIKNKKSMGEA
jgi:hypothetical protein